MVFVKKYWPFLLVACSPFLAFWRLWTPYPLDLVFLDNDVSLIYYSTFIFKVDAISNQGVLPLWAWGLYSGLPFSSTMLNSIFDPYLVPFYLGIFNPESIQAFHIYFIFYLSVGGITFFIFSRSFNYNKIISISGALIYSITGFVSYDFFIGPPAGCVPSAWFPLGLFFIRKFIITLNPFWILLAVFPFSLILLSLHPFVVVVFYYFLIFFLVCLYIENRKTNGLFLSTWLLISFALSFLICSSELIPFFELLQVNPRDKLHQFLHARDNYGENISFEFLKSFFLGGKLAYYHLGTAGGLFALVGIWSRWGKYYTLWISTFVLVVFAFAASSDFLVYDFIYHFVPLLKNLTSPIRAFGVIYMLASAFLVMSGMQYGLKLIRQNPKPSRLAKQGFILVGVLIFTVYIFFSETEGFIRLFYPFVFISFSMVFILSLTHKRKNISICLTCIMILFLIETISTGPRNLEPILHSYADKPEHLMTVKARLSYLFGKSGNSKLPSMMEPRISYHGHNDNLIEGPDNVGGLYIIQSFRAVQAFRMAGFFDARLFKGPRMPKLFWDKQWRYSMVKKLYNLSPSSKGRAWLTPNVNHVNGSPLLKMTKEDFNPYDETFLEQEAEVMHQEFGSFYSSIYRTIDAFFTPAQIEVPNVKGALHSFNEDLELIQQRTNSVVFRLKRDVKSEALFFSDNWYPGWAAYVNGARVPLYVANYSFKGLKLNEKKSTIIEFVFNPPIVKLSYLFSVFGLLLWLGLVIFQNNKMRFNLKTLSD